MKKEAIIVAGIGIAAFVIYKFLNTHPKREKGLALKGEIIQILKHDPHLAPRLQTSPPKVASYTFVTHIIPYNSQKLA